MIYGHFGYSESEYNLIIYARCNVGTPTGRYYEVVELICNGGWMIIFEQLINSGREYRVIDFFIEFVPIVGTTQLQLNFDSMVPETQPEPHQSRYCDPHAGSSRVQPHQREHTPPQNIYSEPFPNMNEFSPVVQAEVNWTQYDNPNNTPYMPTFVDPCPDDDDLPQSDDENDLDYCDDDECDDDDSEDNVLLESHTPAVQTQYFPISGRSDRHPVASFNDTSGFREADVSFFGTTPRFDDQSLAVEQEFHIRKNIEVFWKESSKTKIVVECKDTRCNWRLYATSSYFGARWTIKTLNTPHTCCAPTNRTDHAQLTAAVIANVIRDDIREDITKSISDLKSIVRAHFKGIVPKYNRLWRGRELAIEQMFGSWKDSYAILSPLLQAITRENPGTKWTVRSEPTAKETERLFKAAAWAYGPCIAAVPHLRPIISIDACFLSGRYRGRLLIACGYDAENQLLPLAFGLVQEESFENWGWFMRWLRQEVIGFGRFMCVVSDRHLGIRKVFKDRHGGWWEDGEECIQTLCTQHVAENLMKKVHDKDVCDIFKILVRKRKPRAYAEWMQILRLKCPAAIPYLDKVGKYRDNDETEAPKPWRVFQTFDNGSRWGIMTTNGSESLNNVFQRSRRLPVVALVEDTFYKLVDWFRERKQKAMTRINERHEWSARVEALLVRRGKRCLAMTAISYGEPRGEYDVMTKNEKVHWYDEVTGQIKFIDTETFKYTVITRDDNKVECTCRKPQLTGIPCAHVLAVCRERNFNVNCFINNYYSMNKLLETWSGQFHGFKNQSEWPRYTGPTIVPDKDLISKGRRRHNRIKMTMDEMQGRSSGHQARRSTVERNARNARNARDATGASSSRSGR
ncbi:uncharacterized protein LOC144557190 [Carex rostrata]